MAPCRGMSLALEVTNFNYYLNCMLLLICYRHIIAAESRADEVANFYGHFVWEFFPKEDLFAPVFWFPTIETPASQEASNVIFRRLVSPLANLTHVVLCYARKRDLDSHPTVWDEILDHAVPPTLKLRDEEGHGPEQSMFLTVHVGSYSRFYELPGGVERARGWAPARGHTYELAEDEKEVWELWLQMHDLAIEQREDHALRSINE